MTVITSVISGEMVVSVAQSLLDGSHDVHYHIVGWVAPLVLVADSLQSLVLTIMLTICLSVCLRFLFIFVMLYVCMRPEEGKRKNIMTNSSGDMHAYVHNLLYMIKGSYCVLIDYYTQAI